MSNTKREPLLSDEDVLTMAREEASNWRVENRSDAVIGAEETIYAVRDFYEAARAKDAELIQRLVDGLKHAQKFAEEYGYGPLETAQWDLDAAEVAGFKPSEQ